MFQALNNFIKVPSADSNAQRRGRLLNIMLLGITVVTTLAFLLLIVASFLNIFAEARNLMGGILIMMIGIGLSFWLNHRGNGVMASSVFLVLITAVFAFADTPREVVMGRTLFMFVIPILMASFLLRPYASFVMWGFIAVLHITLAYTASIQDFTPIGLIGFLVIALVAWLAARNLETALFDLQAVNLDLDQRVNTRTRELNIANEQLQTQALELAKTNSLLEQQALDLSSANERLKDLDLLKSKFVSDVSHELRTPISNLLIYLEMMETGTPEKNERYLNVLRDEAARLQKLVTDVLNISRMETGSVKTEYKWVDLNDIVETVVIANHIRADAKGLMLSFEPGQSLPKVWADSDQLNQVVNNLVGNAINYTVKGNVSVVTWMDTEHNRVGMYVRDTGFGITKEDTPLLFERFYRGKHAGQSTIPGTGLGLSITKEIISSHHGTIEVESKVGVGSTFTVYLPASNQQDGAASAEGATA